MNRSFLLTLLVSLTLVCTQSCKPGAPTAKTVDNLKAAITGETTASARYAAFAKKAQEEGYAKIAVLFNAASKAESFHAKKHTSVLEKLGEKMGPIETKFEVKSTKENLEAAIQGESHEITSMYPDFIAAAKAEQKDEAVTSFEWANTVEKIHLDLYKAALAALAKKDFKGLSDKFAVCPLCGNTIDKNVPANCPICGEPRAEFVIIK